MVELDSIQAYKIAQVVKLADTLASGANARKGLGVQVSPWAQLFNIK